MCIQNLELLLIGICKISFSNTSLLLQDIALLKWQVIFTITQVHKLLKEHHTYIWKEYPVLWILESCIQEFRAIFEHKNISYLYLFIEKFKVSSIKELATFAIGLEKYIDAIENAVASDLSNGFVEGMNNKLKMIKRTMYGRSSKKLLEAKLMYRVSD